MSTARSWVLLTTCLALLAAPRTPQAPSIVQAGNKRLPPCPDLAQQHEGYTLEPLPGGGYAVRIQHNKSAKVVIRFDTGDPATPSGNAR